MSRRENVLTRQLYAAGSAERADVAVLRAGGVDGYILLRVSECREFFAVQYFPAGRTSRLDVAIFGTSGIFLGRVLGMSQSGNDRLCNKDFAADRAVFPFCQAVGRAGRSNRRVERSRMAECGNRGLIDQKRMTNDAMLALGQTRFGASGGNCRVDDLGVAECENDLLCDKHFAADRAVFPFCQAVFGAGRVYCMVNRIGVAECGNLRIGRMIATCAGFVGVPTEIKAGGRLCIMDDQIMTKF